MRFSKFISYIFHPVFIPLIVLFTLFNFTSILVNSNSNNICVKSVYILFILVYTILPILTSVVLFKLKLIRSFEMHDNKDRIVPLMTNTIYMILGGIISSSCLNILPFVTSNNDSINCKRVDSSNVTFLSINHLGQIIKMLEFKDKRILFMNI